MPCVTGGLHSFEHSQEELAFRSAWRFELQAHQWMRMIFAGHGAQHFDIFDKFERDGYPSRTFSTESKLEALPLSSDFLARLCHRVISSTLAVGAKVAY
jgi:hypothetical protein